MTTTMVIYFDDDLMTLMNLAVSDPDSRNPVVMTVTDEEFRQLQEVAREWECEPEDVVRFATETVLLAKLGGMNTN